MKRGRDYGSPIKGNNDVVRGLKRGPEVKPGGRSGRTFDDVLTKKREVSVYCDGVTNVGELPVG